MPFKIGKTNVIANALSHRYTLLTALNAKLLGFELIKELYSNDSDFENIFHSCGKSAQGKFYIHDDFLFYLDKLCDPHCSIRALLIKESP